MINPTIYELETLTFADGFDDNGLPIFDWTTVYGRIVSKTFQYTHNFNDSLLGKFENTLKDFEMREVDSQEGNVITLTQYSQSKEVVKSILLKKENNFNSFVRMIEESLECDTDYNVANVNFHNNDIGTLYSPPATSDSWCSKAILAILLVLVLIYKTMMYNEKITYFIKSQAFQALIRKIMANLLVIILIAIAATLLLNTDKYHT